MRNNRLPLQHNARSGKSSTSSIRTILGCFGISLITFYLGVLLGLHSGSNCPPCQDNALSVQSKSSEDVLVSLDRTY